MATRSPDPQLGNEDRNSNKQHATEIDEDEGAAAAHAHHVRELPDIAEADCRPDRGQDERETR